MTTAGAAAQLIPSAVDSPAGRPGVEPPTGKVGPVFVTAFAIAQLTLFIALLGPVMVSMALKVTALVGPSEAPTATGLILGVGAIAALIGNPLFGWMSDRTTSRWGRRRPWLIGGSIGLAVCLFAIAVAPSVPVLVAAWFGAQLAANGAFAAYLATVADQVPPKQSATVTALAGVMQSVGILLAVQLVSVLSQDMIGMFMIPAAIGVVGMTVYALVLPDKRLPARPPSGGWRAIGQMFWLSPRRYPDFAWAWVSRCLLILGSFLFTTFRLFWMIDELALNETDATAAVATGVLIYTVVLVVVGQVAGYVSDRLGRRKVLVFASTALFALGLGLLPMVHTVGGFYMIEVILGAAYGIYMGVDLALVLAVLPNPENAAKDLGVFNIANAAPQSLAPFLGAGLLSIGGGHNYTLLYLTAAVLVFVGALTIIPVKQVR
ncbi:MFS transporter [Pseudonocardia sp. TRM90224]|uniref:MFS transporter n=1 Tax=Pseudonocardia sp. TRM90224 TaxID=2812678 RepID=UPI001E370ED9|nr:MFS transporter [Pseudonocardia sp. TRM90224]